MTRVKKKWDFWEHLLYSQDIERHEAETDHGIAEELCDHIAASIQWMEEGLGFDAAEMFSKRVAEKSDDFPAIIRKYREKLGEAIAQARETEP